MLAGSILVIDDDQCGRKLTSILLRNRGYQVDTATTALEGLRKFRPHLPDLLLVGFLLPDRDGLDFVRLLRQLPECAFLPIIAVTACAMVGDKERALEAGCNDYVTKPLNASVLVAAVAVQLDRTAALRGLPRSHAPRSRS